MNASRLKSVAIALAVVAVVATVLGVYIHRTSPPDKAGDTPTKGTNAAARAALTVTTTQPVATQLPIKLSANGNIAAWQEASVRRADRPGARGVGQGGAGGPAAAPEEHAGAGA
jgi:hypothetical protein